MRIPNKTSYNIIKGRFTQRAAFAVCIPCAIAAGIGRIFGSRRKPLPKPKQPPKQSPNSPGKKENPDSKGKPKGKFHPPLPGNSRSLVMQNGEWKERDKPNGGGYKKDYYHIGVDLKASQGTSVFAIADGTVLSPIYTTGPTEQQDNFYFGPGNSGIFVSHTLTDGTAFVSVYIHVRPLVKPGQKVVGGSPIGTIGPWYDEDHLHLGLWRGSTIPSTDKKNGKGWGMMNNVHWDNTFGYEDPLAWMENPSHVPKLNNE